MKVAHMAVITPRRCGLYETTRELVKSLRDIGIDSRLVDPTGSKNLLMPSGTEDRGAPFASMDWAKDADILVNHSGLGEELEKSNIPVVHVAHGRPRHSFLSEASGSTPIYSYHYHNNNKDQFKSVVTFWPQHKPYLEVMYPDKPVHYVQSPVDLDFWKPAKSDYDFGGLGGDFNIVCTDAFRDDIDCYVPLNAFALTARKNSGMKLHIFGKPKDMRGWGSIIKTIQNDGNMGLVQGWAKSLETVYRKADLVLTAHEIDVRTVREATACGCPVVRISDDIRDCEDKILTALHSSRESARIWAEDNFNPKVTALQFKRVLEDAIH